MSAFIVDHAHIDALLNWAVSNRVDYYVPQSMNNKPGGLRVDINTQNATEIGAILLTENERSVRHRYPSCGANDLPGTIGQDAASYRFKFSMRAPLSAVQAIKACHCLSYQCCETDDWEGTLAHRILSAIQDSATYKLPGYDSAAWEIRAT